MTKTDLTFQTREALRWKKKKKKPAWWSGAASTKGCMSGRSEWKWGLLIAGLPPKTMPLLFYKYIMLYEFVRHEKAGRWLVMTTHSDLSRTLACHDEMLVMIADYLYKRLTTKGRNGSTMARCKNQRTRATLTTPVHERVYYRLLLTRFLI